MFDRIALSDSPLDKVECVKVVVTNKTELFLDPLCLRKLSFIKSQVGFNKIFLASKITLNLASIDLIN